VFGAAKVHDSRHIDDSTEDEGDSVNMAETAGKGVIQRLSRRWPAKAGKKAEKLSQRGLTPVV